MKDHRRRVMIIVWWWTYGGLDAPSDVWHVEDSAGGDCVVRIDQRYSDNAKTIIADKAREFLSDSQVFIFLHRNHGYNGKAIQEILGEIKNDQTEATPVRCFLFGEGNGSLYIASNPRGLLGTKGTFKAQRINGITQWIDATSDSDLKFLKKEHFDNVWQAYAKAFKSKVFELKEDIFLALSPFLTRQELKANELYQHLRKQENKLLFLRLLSFTGKLRKGSSQERTLHEQENKLGRALDFDDFSTNLTAVYNPTTSGIYNDLIKEINQNLFTGTHEYDLSQLRDHFTGLLESMPGEVYN